MDEKTLKRVVAMAIEECTAGDLDAYAESYVVDEETGETSYGTKIGVGNDDWDMFFASGEEYTDFQTKYGPFISDLSERIESVVATEAQRLAALYGE